MQRSPISESFKQRWMTFEDSERGQKFDHWIEMNGNTIIEKPDTIRSRKLHSDAKPCGMVFSLWEKQRGGLFQAILVPTPNLPENIRIVVDNHNQSFYIQFNHNALTKDRLNAYCAIATHALFRREFNLLNLYVDSIFHFNPNPIPGWALKYAGYKAKGDITNAINAIDSLLYIIDNKLDEEINAIQNRRSNNPYWLDDFKVNFEWEKWNLSKLKQSIYIFPH